MTVTPMAADKQRHVQVLLYHTDMDIRIVIQTSWENIKKHDIKKCDLKQKTGLQIKSSLIH